MRLFLLSIITLAAVLASGCTSNQPSAGPAQNEAQYLQDPHVRYYEEIRARVALGTVGGECGAQ